MSEGTHIWRLFRLTQGLHFSEVLVLTNYFILKGKKKIQICQIYIYRILFTKTQIVFSLLGLLSFSHEIHTVLTAVKF